MDSTGANSYPPLFTIQSQCTEIHIDKAQVTIDRIVLTTFYLPFKTLDNALHAISTNKKDTGTRNRNGTINPHERIKTYSLQGKRLSVPYDTYHDSNEPQRLFITLDEPDGIMMEAVNKIFLSFNIVPFVSKIEIAWDFYTGNVLLLQEWMEKHLWLSYNRKGVLRYKNTFYVSDLRNSVKGIRIYPRPKNADHYTYLRLELELHRSVIKKLGIQFPIFAEQFPSDFAKYFRFHHLAFGRLTKAYLRKNRLDKPRIKRNVSHPARGGAEFLLQQQYAGEIRSIKHLHSRTVERKGKYLFVKYHPSSLVEQMEKVKGLGLSNPSRFMEPFAELNHIISNLPHEQGFCL